MSHSNKVGLGRVTILSRDGPALVEPRGAGLVMSTLRSADEVHPAKFGAKAKGEIDVDMVAIADGIIECRLGAFNPTSFQDRYQDAPRELVEAKTAGLETMPLAIVEPPKVIDREEALKRSPQFVDYRHTIWHMLKQQLGAMSESIEATVNGE